MLEEWKWIKGYEGLYQISNLGRVKTFHDNPAGKIKKLRQNSTKKGYLQVSLVNDGVEHGFYIHRLLYAHFVAPIPSGMVVRHLNDIATDNRLENLALGTMRDNTHDARRNGTHRWIKLTEEDVWLIKQLIVEGVGQVAIAKMFQVSQGLISRIKSGTTWKS